MNVRYTACRLLKLPSKLIYSKSLHKRNRFYVGTYLNKLLFHIFFCNKRYQFIFLKKDES